MSFFFQDALLMKRTRDMTQEEEKQESEEKQEVFEDYPDPFYRPPKTSVEAIYKRAGDGYFGLLFRNRISTEKLHAIQLQAWDVNDKKNVCVVKIYDICPRVYQTQNDDCLKERYKKLGSEKIVKNYKFGCGLHALKNLIFMTRLFLQPKKKNLKAIAHDMNKFFVFLHYLEGGTKKEMVNNYSINTWRNRWLDDIPGQQNWLSIWEKDKKTHFDDPPATLQDVKRLKKCIFEGTAFAPNGSRLVLSHTITLGDMNQSKFNQDNIKKKIMDVKDASNDESVWTNGIKKLKEAFDSNEDFVAPLHIYYSYICNGIPGRHWVTVIVRSIEKGTLEIFLIDSSCISFGSGLLLSKNITIMQTLLAELNLLWPG
jgi:hypothetical protein